VEVRKCWQLHTCHIGVYHAPISLGGFLFSSGFSLKQSSMLIVYVLLAAMGGLGIGILITTTMIKKSIEKKSQQILEDAKAEGEVLKKNKILEAKEKYIKLKSEHDNYVHQRKQGLHKLENKLNNRENHLNNRNEEIKAYAFGN
jgi:predicted membrane protein